MTKTDPAANDSAAHDPVDNVERTLEQWQETHRTRPTPASRIWVAHLLAEAGRDEEARATARPIAPKQKRREYLALAEKKLFHPALINDWLRLTVELFDELDKPPADTEMRAPLVKRVFSRLSRIGDLLEAGPDARRLALSLWNRLPLEDWPPYLKSEGRFILFLQLLGADEAGAALVPKLLRKAQNKARIASRVHAGMVEHYGEDHITAAELLRYAALFPDDTALAGKVAHALLAAMPEAEALALVANDLPVLSAIRENLIRAALGRGETWTAEWLLAQFQSLHDGDTRLQELGAEIAQQMRDPWLALVRTLPQDAASVTLGQRVLGLAYSREASRMLAPRAAQDEDSAIAWVEARKWELAAVNSSEPVRELYEKLGGTKLRNALARNLADELEYETAESLLLESVAEKPHRQTVWRDLCGFYRRTANYPGWTQTLQEIRTRFPDSQWGRAQALNHAFELGDRAVIDEMLAKPDPEVVDTTNILEVRTISRQLMIEDRQQSSVQNRRLIVRYTDAPNDYVRLILATFQAAEFEKAVEIVDSCIARFPGDARFHVKRAQAHERHQEYAPALACYTRSLAVGINSPDAQCGVARCLVYLKRSDDALRWLDRFPQDRIEFAWVHSMRAFAHAYAGGEDRILPALEPIYTLSTRLNLEFEEAQRTDPASVWYNGLRRHPNPQWPAYAARYQQEVDRMRAGSIALVGNSPNLLGAGKGPEIDAHDYVIRLNDFRLHGYEPDVGAKTSLWYSSANRLARPDQQAVHNARTFIYQPRAQHFPDLPAFARGRLNVELDEKEATYLPPHVHLLTSRMIYPRPSTGLRVCTMLEFLVQRPYAIAGLDFFQSAQLHYFEQEQSRLRVGEVHAIDFEKDFTELVLTRRGFMSRL